MCRLVTILARSVDSKYSLQAWYSRQDAYFTATAATEASARRVLVLADDSLPCPALSAKTNQRSLLHSGTPVDLRPTCKRS
jgi:hypothetical protein